MMSTSDYMVESTAYPFHLDPQRIRRPFIYANIIQKMTSWKCPPCGTGILRDFISLTARPNISNRINSSKAAQVDSTEKATRCIVTPD
ncbi:hypothetical protein AVEN_176084-1 [Araneus ventricosus]|uniref:Uncharacterized protein n=1 Tax=Araneus ventricosus TaxID=182803 RepID=A0A4Y2FQJ6_ARAVE|nr:hypothetical protein AVEN_176084-1 [Araneus ventricosus]